MDEDRICWLCGKSGPLERHHAFKGGLRKKADRYGAYVYLCPECHRTGPKSTENSGETRALIARACQRKIMAEQGWDMARWHEEFGKNWL